MVCVRQTRVSVAFVVIYTHQFISPVLNKVLVNSKHFHFVAFPFGEEERKGHLEDGVESGSAFCPTPKATLLFYI